MRWAFLLFAFLLVACSPSVGGIPTRIVTPVTLTITPTSVSPTLTVSPSPHATHLPTNTFIPRTPTSPTIPPLFTPTFDIRTIVTVTPAPKAECPKENPAITINLIPPLYTLDDFKRKQGHLILDALNKGLSFSTLKAETEKGDPKAAANYFQIYHQDVTGDGVNDIVLSDYHAFDIFYCSVGRYELFALEDGPEFYPWSISGIWEIIDRNQNGLPEIVFYQFINLHRSFWIFHIYEWDGKTFVDLTDNPDTYDEITSFQFKRLTKEDVNHDGLTDFVFTDGGSYDGLGLWSRVKTTTYSWNGKYYVKSYVSYAKPQYRYQAIQDADRETGYGHYEKAIALYQEAIFNPDLDWMSYERVKYQIALDSSQYDKPTPTVYPTPIPDESEYPQLAAYAYYRMVILHVFLNEINAAQTQYTTLQTKFSADSPGRPYAEMAAKFWDVYKTSGKIDSACAAAIAYAKQHEKIFDVLEGPGGGDTLYYTPADVCPFR